MKKELKKDSYKISRKIILSCAVIVTMVLSNTSISKALDTNNAYVI